ncbi:BUB3-interacting and GLEBS motif-containing protein ZNF207-like [Dendronephthya gigantea]|uniref:BUB3-interacting and GLEBS motif-containing protein ZNF207-like n=1 Tax=Dendronephthya gigantea TaxID=151771 RepID=UPI001068FDFD|nr:BUB3-interacting and GLEBS motif-containing protein ZNF207-like [Dendronephthya gigantea]XP_028395504.1 BUB3-interacting and GLEBS motif-containing protein ZNF207-like [Dendronephthya gigantea]
MGRKKKKPMKPWCWYCNREFDDEKVLIQHQKAKHFKCFICHKKLYTGPGLAIHCMQVHKEHVSAIPNSLPNRGDPEIEIYGMEGIPEKDVKERRQKLAQMSQGGEDDDDESEGGTSKKAKTDTPQIPPVGMMPMGAPPMIPGMPMMPPMMPGFPVPGFPPGFAPRALMPGMPGRPPMPPNMVPPRGMQPQGVRPGAPGSKPLFPSAQNVSSPQNSSSSGPVGADFKPLTTNSKPTTVYSAPPTSANSRPSSSNEDKPGVPVSKPATVPSTGATSTIIHPDEDISLEEHIALLPRYKARTQGTPTSANPTSNAPVAPPCALPFPSPLMPPGLPGMPPNPIHGPPGALPPPGAFPPMPMPGQNMMQQQPHNMMPLMGRGPNNQSMGMPSRPPMGPPPQMPGPPGHFGPPQRF